MRSFQEQSLEALYVPVIPRIVLTELGLSFHLQRALINTVSSRQFMRRLRLRLTWRNNYHPQNPTEEAVMKQGELLTRQTLATFSSLQYVQVDVRPEDSLLSDSQAFTLERVDGIGEPRQVMSPDVW